MGYCLNRLDEPVFMAGPKPMQTEFGIHHRLESCEQYFLRGLQPIGMALKLSILQNALQYYKFSLLGILLYQIHFERLTSLALLRLKLISLRVCMSHRLKSVQNISPDQNRLDVFSVNWFMQDFLPSAGRP